MPNKKPSKMRLRSADFMCVFTLKTFLSINYRTTAKTYL